MRPRRAERQRRGAGGWRTRPSRGGDTRRAPKGRGARRSLGYTVTERAHACCPAGFPRWQPHVHARSHLRLTGWTRKIWSSALGHHTPLNCIAVRVTVPFNDVHAPERRVLCRRHSAGTLAFVADPRSPAAPPGRHRPARARRGNKRGVDARRVAVRWDRLGPKGPRGRAGGAGRRLRRRPAGRWRGRAATARDAARPRPPPWRAPAGRLGCPRCAPPASRQHHARAVRPNRGASDADVHAGAGRVEVGCSPPNITFLTECNIFRCRAHSGDHNALSYGMPSIGYLIWARVLTPPDRLWRYYRVRRTVGEICRRRPRARWCRGCVEGAPTW